MMHKKIWLFLVPGVLLMAHSAGADEAWNQIVLEYDNATSKWKEKLSENASKGIKIVLDESTPTHPRDVFRPRVKEYAAQHEGKSDAVPALAWLVTHEYRFPMGYSSGETAKWALACLKRDHVTDPVLKDHLDDFQMRILSIDRNSLISFMDAVAAKNPDKEARGRAQLVTAVHLSDDELGMAYRGSGDSKESKRSEKIFRSLVKDYAGTDIAEQAENYLFVVDYLQVGMRVPETVGKDVDGNEIKLSDFRGKVVMIAFWATWCAPCMQALTYERELMQTHADKPFTVLGINVDDKQSTCRRAIKKENITWPNIHDGGHGGIATKWHVRSFPTTIMLDHKGIIRYIDSEALGVDELLAEAMAAKNERANP